MNEKIAELNDEDEWGEADKETAKIRYLNAKISILEYEKLGKDLEILNLKIDQLTEELEMNNNSRIKAELRQLKREKKQLDEKLDSKAQENLLCKKFIANNSFPEYDLSEDENDDGVNNTPSL
ncbi:hypothetical protein [Rickettsiella massiliensis]|uniref:hypothetical protein n=1 Tax=Rickettsiella massiliensis TaxID=676517 RepID=UPI00029B3A2A|nr:hypothetical protein [Rickettsiella massiliensis]